MPTQCRGTGEARYLGPKLVKGVPATVTIHHQTVTKHSDAPHKRFIYHTPVTQQPATYHSFIQLPEINLPPNSYSTTFQQPNQPFWLPGTHLPPNYWHLIKTQLWTTHLPLYHLLHSLLLPSNQQSTTKWTYTLIYGMISKVVFFFFCNNAILWKLAVKKVFTFIFLFSLSNKILNVMRLGISPG